jgi:hypothetical protein
VFKTVMTAYTRAPRRTVRLDDDWSRRRAALRAPRGGCLSRLIHTRNIAKMFPKNGIDQASQMKFTDTSNKANS